jgi:hypothetical protein
MWVLHLSFYFYYSTYKEAEMRGERENNPGILFQSKALGQLEARHILSQ